MSRTCIDSLLIDKFLYNQINNSTSDYLTIEPPHFFHNFDTIFNNKYAKYVTIIGCTDDYTEHPIIELEISDVINNRIKSIIITSSKIYAYHRLFTNFANLSKLILHHCTIEGVGNIIIPNNITHFCLEHPNFGFMHLTVIITIHENLRYFKISRNDKWVVDDKCIGKSYPNLKYISVSSANIFLEQLSNDTCVSVRNDANPYNPLLLNRLVKLRNLRELMPAQLDNELILRKLETFKYLTTLEFTYIYMTVDSFKQIFTSKTLQYITVNCHAVHGTPNNTQNMNIDLTELKDNNTLTSLKLIDVPRNTRIKVKSINRSLVTFTKQCGDEPEYNLGWDRFLDLYRESAPKWFFDYQYTKYLFESELIYPDIVVHAINNYL